MGEEIAVERRTDASNPAPPALLSGPAYGAANHRVVENQWVFGWTSVMGSRELASTAVARSQKGRSKNSASENW